MRCLVVGASISWRSGRLLTSRYRFHTWFICPPIVIWGEGGDDVKSCRKVHRLRPWWSESVPFEKRPTRGRVGTPLATLHPPLKSGHSPTPTQQANSLRVRKPNPNQSKGSAGTNRLVAATETWVISKVFPPNPMESLRASQVAVRRVRAAIAISNRPVQGSRSDRGLNALTSTWRQVTDANRRPGTAKPVNWRLSRPASFRVIVCWWTRNYLWAAESFPVCATTTSTSLSESWEVAIFCRFLPTPPSTCIS